MDNSAATDPFYQIVYDQMGNKVQLLLSPHRIISLVPSQTELLFDLGLSEKIVGITKFCIHPADQVKAKTKIGGTKNFHLERIRDLQPDLIIGNKEENYPEGIATLQQHYPVWMSDINNLADALNMITAMGTITGTEQRASALVNTITSGFRHLLAVKPIPTAYFIWKNPYMAVGSGTFIHDIMEKAGFQNVFSHVSRYPEVTPDMLQKAKPQLILLSSEPYPFQEKHLEEFRAICPKANVIIIDGELFSWYGSRLLQTASYIQNLQQVVLANIGR